jgi:hypothetical protein
MALLDRHKLKQAYVTAKQLYLKQLPMEELRMRLLADAGKQ